MIITTIEIIMNPTRTKDSTTIKARTITAVAVITMITVQETKEIAENIVAKLMKEEMTVEVL